MTAPARIRQSDIDRTFKAAQRAGFRSVQVHFRPDGEVVVTATDEPQRPAPENEWDDVLQ